MNDTNYDYDLLVFIGRFSPFHNEHKRIIDVALEKSKHVLVLIGSAGKARTIRNPWTYQERSRMILGNYPNKYAGIDSEWGESRVITRPLFDKTYNDNAWIKQVQDVVRSVALEIINEGHSLMASGIVDRNFKIGLIGTSKDKSSYYLKMFPQWDNIDVPLRKNLGATELRDFYFKNKTHEPAGTPISLNCPPNIVDFLYRNWHPATEVGFNKTTYYNTLREEMLFVEKYKESWKSAPYPVKHLTVDAVVEQSGHILLVKRRSAPGKGLWALPGGHLEIDETMVDGVIRELREETKIKVPIPVLKGSIVNQRMFDDPHRSTIGRVVTMAYHFNLKDDIELPKVKGSDDAEKAVWVPLSDIKEDQLFDDHYFIINYFLGLS